MLKNLKMKTLSILFLALLMAACQKGVEFSQYVSLSNGWAAHEPIAFKIEQAMRKVGENQGLALLKGITEVGLRVETDKR